MVLDNHYDAATAVKNAEEFIRNKVDLVIEFQVEQEVAPMIGDKIAAAKIPLIGMSMVFLAMAIVAVTAYLHAGWWSIVGYGIAAFGAYALVLAALERAPAAPVAAVRETSVGIATALAALVLGERVGPARLAGAFVVVGGVALIALS